MNIRVMANKPHWRHKYQCEICMSTFVRPNLAYDPTEDHIGEKCPYCNTFDLFRKFNYEKYKLKKKKFEEKLKKKAATQKKKKKKE